MLERASDTANNIEELRKALAAKDNFLPTPEQVNALPPRLREYIHSLEARCDPSGDVRENIIARDTCRALELKLVAKDAEIKRLEQYGIDTHREYETMAAERNSYYAETENLRESLAAKERECEKLRAKLRDSANLAAALAHRACCGTEHDPANGKLHGYCVVCGVEWPCATALFFMPDRAALADTNLRKQEVGEEQCPVCGYYCLGGSGCIDKPSIR